MVGYPSCRILTHGRQIFTKLRNHTPFQLRRHWRSHDPRDRVASFPFPLSFPLASFVTIGMSRTLDPPSGCKSFRAKQQRAFFPDVVGTGTGNAMTSHDRVDSLSSLHRHLSFAIGTTLIMAVDQPLGCIIRLQHRQGLFQVAVRIRHRGSSKPL